MMGRVYILGGTGKVGTYLMRTLASEAAEILTVSRRATGPDGQSRHISLDLATSGAVIPVRPGDVVINLTEATSLGIVTLALRSGANFIETSATPEYVLSLRRAALQAEAPGLLVDCVGVAPGLTNLMAHELVGANPTLRRLFIGGELGLGEHAGLAATKWFFESLGTRSLGKVDGVYKELTTGSVARRFPFTADRPERLALNFPFIEQRILAEEFDDSVDTVLTFLAFSPPWVTHLLRHLLRLKIGGIDGRHAAWLSKIMLAGPSIGETTTRIAVFGEDSAGRPIGPIRLETGDQSRATAAMTGAVARLASTSFPAPVSTVCDWLSLDDAVRTIRESIPQTRLSVERTAPTGQWPLDVNGGGA